MVSLAVSSSGTLIQYVHGTLPDVAQRCHTYKFRDRLRLHKKLSAPERLVIEAVSAFCDSSQLGADSGVGLFCERGIEFPKTRQGEGGGYDACR